MQPMQQPKRIDDVSEMKMDPNRIATGTPCKQDAITYCQKETSLVALLREAPDLVEPMKIMDAVRNVRLCMTTHADMLSVECLNTLVVDAVDNKSMTSASSPSKKVVALDKNGLDDDSSIEINIYYSRHHNSAGHALRSGSELAANHVQPQGTTTNVAEVLAHPLTWAFVLPFFVIGVYVCFTRLATFVRRRREERRIESKQYIPVH